MRNIPVDTSALTFVCVSPPRPKLVNQDTGEVKTDRNGQTVFTVGLSAADAMGRVDLLNVAVTGEQPVTIGEVVMPVGLVAFPWEAVLGGEKRWGVAYRANRIAPVGSAGPNGSGSSGSSAAAGGLWAWRRFHPASFWYGIAFPLRAVLVYLSWHHVASGCRLTRTRRRFRLTLDAVPVMGPASRSAATVVEHKRRVRRVDVERAPRLGLLRPTRLGWRMRVRLHDGQVPADYEKAAEGIAHAWRVHAVRVVDVCPGYVTLWATMRDPLTDVVTEPETGELLRVRPGKLENGHDWVIDFRTVPHWLNAGATQSGKSNLANALIKGLAPQPVALVGFDLKGGVEFTPYAPRLSALATSREESVDLLADLVGEVENRMGLCRAHGARNVWTLPEHLRPVPVVVLVDEVAELFLMADKSEKDQVSRTATALLRVAQLGRAFAVYLVVCGQRIGSDLGPGVTALRAQLSGRVCHRVNDPETANMTLGDLDPAALDTARAIPAETPGVCVVAGQDGTWHRARSVYVSEQAAERAARDWAHLAPAWETLIGSPPTAIPDAA